MSNTWGVPYDLEFHAVATFISAIAYGLVISLYMLCCHALFKDQRKYSTQKKWFFLSYATIMFSLSTLTIVEDMKTLIIDAFVNPDPILILVEAILYYEIPFMVIPFAWWGADFLMVSRDF